MGKCEKTLTKKIREAQDSGIQMWTMINKLNWIESEISLYDEDGVVIEETRTSEEMLVITLLKKRK